VKKTLIDDTAHFSAVKYPVDVFADSPNPPVFSVSAYPQLNLSFGHRSIFFPAEYPFSFTIPDVRRCFAVRFSAPFPRGTIARRDGQKVNEQVPVQKLRQDTFSVNDPPGYRLLPLIRNNDPRPFVVGERSTVFELIAQLQADTFARGGVVRALSIFDREQELNSKLEIRQIHIRKCEGLDVHEGAEWPSARVEFSYRFEESPVYKELVPVCAPLAFIRAVIARRRRIPPDHVELFEGGSPLAGRLQEPLQRERAFDAATPKIMVHLRGESPVNRAQLPLSDRVYDIISRLVGSRRQLRFRLYLSLGGRLLRDPESITEAGIEDGSEINVLRSPTPIVRLYLRDLDGTVRSVTTSHGESTFGRNAAMLLTDPRPVEFFYRGERLNATDTFQTHFWDPDDPIVVRLRSPEMTVNDNHRLAGVADAGLPGESPLFPRLSSCVARSVAADAKLYSVELFDNGVRRSARLDTTKPLKVVLPEIARQLGIAERFTLHFHKSEVDEDVAIQDLGSNPSLEIVREPKEF
jgi:hypothetical protein